MTPYSKYNQKKFTLSPEIQQESNSRNTRADVVLFQLRFPYGHLSCKPGGLCVLPWAYDITPVNSRLSLGREKNLSDFKLLGIQVSTSTKENVNSYHDSKWYFCTVFPKRQLGWMRCSFVQQIGRQLTSSFFPWKQTRQVWWSERKEKFQSLPFIAVCSLNISRTPSLTRAKLFPHMHVHAFSQLSVVGE